MRLLLALLLVGQGIVLKPADLPADIRVVYGMRIGYTVPRHDCPITQGCSLFDPSEDEDLQARRRALVDFFQLQGIPDDCHIRERLDPSMTCYLVYITVAVTTFPCPPPNEVGYKRLADIPLHDVRLPNCGPVQRWAIKWERL